MAAQINSIKVRMYCLGTGDCLALKFFAGKSHKYTMLIDCGSCSGGPKEFKPYLENLAEYVKDGVDLLVITHEHNDHVNGFAKHPNIFKDMKIKKAWMAWTEHPEDPDGRADDLIHKRKNMRLALNNAMNIIKTKEVERNLCMAGDYFQLAAAEAHTAFLDGLNTLAEINLPAAGKEDDGLAGMVAIKEILKDKKIKPRYMHPGEVVTISDLPGLKFYILGPPYETEAIYKHEKEGVDVYKRKLSFSKSALATKAFNTYGKSDDLRDKDIPFAEEFIANEKKPSIQSKLTSKQTPPTSAFNVTAAYNNPLYTWRKINTDWLNSAGTLALRLNSHINNTSLAMAIEAEGSKNVVLLPGDAEFGSWQSWHNIEKWNKKGKNAKHLVEDLLNRTVFYKVSHHLSFNGTPTTLGVDMMESEDMVAMATLDRNRISPRWKGTMPNKRLMEDFMRICKGRLIIMNEFEIKNAPSKDFDFSSLGNDYVEHVEEVDGKEVLLYKEYTVKM